MLVRSLQHTPNYCCIMRSQYRMVQARMQQKKVDVEQAPPFSRQRLLLRDEIEGLQARLEELKEMMRKEGCEDTVCTVPEDLIT